MPGVGVDELVTAICDAGTFSLWEFEAAVPAAGINAEYAGELDAARERSGRAESITAGQATIGGRQVAIIASNFDFLAGTAGAAACGIVISALARAAELGLPVFASPASGGTRMQEGTAAFVLMADVAGAVTEYHSAGQPMIVWLRNPTTGGVMATWGSLGTITTGEPGALAGFLGPRVFEALNGEPFPPGVQTTANLAACGVIDEEVPLAQLRGYLARVLAVTSDGPEPLAAHPGAVVQQPVPAPGIDAWEAVLSTRRPERPGAVEVVANCTDVTRLHGTGEGERSDAIILALARVGGLPCVIAAQDRSAADGLSPAALRTARRGMRVAAQLSLPFVTIIDTEGAELSVEAEEGALAGEIGRCLAQLRTLSVPSVSLLLGQGCGGGALALFPARRVLAAQRSWLSALPLEGASVIRYRTPDRAPEMARAQHITAPELQALGVVDELIAELPDAAQEPDAFAARAVAAIARALTEMMPS